MFKYYVRVQNISMANIYKCGYSGGIGGKEFDDYTNEEIKNSKSISIHRIEIKTSLIPTVIGSIQTVYNIDGKVYKSDKHGELT